MAVPIFPYRTGDMRFKPIVVCLVLLLAVVAWMGLGGSNFGIPASSPSNPTNDSTTSTSVPTSNDAPTGSTSGSAAAAGLTQNPAAAMAAKALAATRTAGLNPDVVYVPRPSATPSEVAEAAETGAAAPLYTGDPAPMGLADYGLSKGQNGHPIASTLNTTGLQGYVDANATGIQGEDLYQAVPDSFSIQMNAVLTSVTVLGTPGYQYWTQDVVTYFPATGFMLLVTNVWNFSSPSASMTPGTIYAHGPYGSSDYSTLGYYFASYQIPHAVSYPFNVMLSMSSLVSGGRNEVSFSASLMSTAHPSDDFDMNNYDYVVFNSIAPQNPVPVTQPSNYTASGSGYNRVGLWDDFELVICGPGGGSQVDLSTADATLGLAYNAGHGLYLAVPSAYNYGSDTGETSTGANIAWNAGFPTPSMPVVVFATVTTGPSILSGLWGTQAPIGSIPVQLDISPANAFTFFSYSGPPPGFSQPFVQEYAFAPSMATNTFYLMPGTYQVRVELADYSEASFVLTPYSSMVKTVQLTKDSALGVYTPLWAFSNSELGALAASGTGTTKNPYVLYNNQNAPLSSTFGLYNDYSFPVFPGVFLKGTTASVELNNSSTFEAYTNDFQPAPASGLPPTNDLQLWFWGVSGVALHNDSNISGWFGKENYFPLTFNSFNVIFYASQNNLVAGNIFLTQSQGLLMYASGTLFGPPISVGGSNTVWGNQFIQTDPPTGCPGPGTCTTLLPYNSGLALEIGEANDLVYNNIFNTPTTAWLLPLNLYSEAPILWTSDHWNIASQPASDVNYASGFPTIPLTGSIVGGSTQGGNSWWDFGNPLNWANGADNPSSSVPYVENANSLLDPLPGFGAPLPGYPCTEYYCATYIYSGGDYDPLSTVASAVTLGEQGLISGTVWGAEVTCAPPHSGGGGPPGSVCCGPPHSGGGGPPGCASDPPAIILAEFETNARTVNLTLPNGYLTWIPLTPPAGYTTSSGGSFNVSSGFPDTLFVPFASPTTATFVFSESGLPSGLTWKVTVGSSPMSLTTDGGTDSLAFTGNAGVTYPYTIAPISGWQQSTLAATGTVKGGAITEPTLEYAQETLAAGTPTATPTSIDYSQQTSTITSHATGGASPGANSFQWYYSSASSPPSTGCGGAGWTLFGGTGSTQVTGTEITGAGTYDYCYVVTDSSGYSQTSGFVSVAVSAALHGGTAMASPTKIDYSQETSTITAHDSGGSSPGSNSYVWYYETGTAAPALACGGTGWSPFGGSISTQATGTEVTGAGTYYYCYVVTDSNSESQSSGYATVTVSAALVAGTATANPGEIDYDGPTSTIMAHDSGGSSPGSNTYAWFYASGGSAPSTTCGSGGWTSLPGAGSGPSIMTGGEITGPGTYYYCYVVTDSNSESQSSGPATVTVSAALQAGTATANPASIDYLQQTSTITADDSGGSAPGSNSYAWYYASGAHPPGAACGGGGWTPVSGSGTGASMTTGGEISGAATYYYCYVVTDSNLNSQPSGFATVVVSPTLVGGVASTDTPAIDLGQTATIDSNVVGGTSAHSFEWYYASGLAPSASCGGAGWTSFGGTSSTQVTGTEITGPGTYDYCYVVTDSNSESEASAVAVLTVFADPTVSVAPPGPASYDVGQSAGSLTATVTSSGPNKTPVEWYSSASSACGASSTDTGFSGLTFTPSTTAAGSTWYCAVVADSGVPGYSSPSNAVEVTVFADPSVSVTPGTVSYQVGQTAAAITATVTYLGPNSAVVHWYASSSSSMCDPIGSALGSGTSFTPNTSAPGTTSYCAVVTDSGVPAYHGSSGTGVVTVMVLLSASITVTPGQGPIGATVTVSGTGFSASTTLQSLVFDGVTISSCQSGSLTTNAAGSFSCTFPVPRSCSKSTAVIATDVTGATATGSFTVTKPSISVSPGQGPIGATVTVSGTGFSVSTPLKSLSFDGATIASCQSGSLTTSVTGAFSCTFRVPRSCTSSTTVTATDIGGQSASTKFKVTHPCLSVHPSEGRPGSTVTVSGTGFSVSTSLLSFDFDGVTITSCTTGSLTTSATGSFSCTLTVPSNCSSTTVTATDVGGQSASTKFKVT
jgi:thermopsin